MKNEKPILTVVTVVKNDLEGLRRTCNSVRRQVGIQICHIIVDGGSSDGSQDLAAETSDIFIPSFNDGGIYKGMQRGASASDAQFIMFLNSSDEMVGTDLLAGVVDLMEKNGIKWGFGPIIEQTGRGTKILTSTEGAVDLKSIAWRRTFVPFPTTVMSKELFDAIGGFSYDFRIAGDFDLIVRATKNVRPARWPTPFVLFQAGGISYTSAPAAWREEHQIRLRTLEMTAINQWQSRIHVFLRVAKWRFGKVLDSIQNSGAFGKTHWRDRRGILAPDWIVALIDRNGKDNKTPQP